MTPHMKSQHQALSIIRNEHRTLTAVIEALRHVADEIAAGQLTPDYRLLWSILYYIEAYPDRLHHPKEDDVLFPAVRARTQDTDAVIEELGRQHVNGRIHLDKLKSLCGWMEAEVPGAAREFAEKVTTYAGFHFRHMEQEETQVMPKAVEVLTEDDWVRIAASFAENRDPLGEGGAAGDEWFRQLFRRIVNLVPEPWGVGPRR